MMQPAKICCVQDYSELLGIVVFSTLLLQQFMHLPLSRLSGCIVDEYGV